MRLFNSKDDPLYLSKRQWTKLFVAFSIMILVLYIGAMIASLCGSEYFILNYQNAQMDKIEAFLESYQIMPLLNCVFLALEFSIILSFVLKKKPSVFYVIAFYGIRVAMSFIFKIPAIVNSIYPFAFYFIVPVID